MKNTLILLSIEAASVVVSEKARLLQLCSRIELVCNCASIAIKTRSSYTLHLDGIVHLAQVRSDQYMMGHVNILDWSCILDYWNGALEY